jgi:hypothetical protein
MGVGSSATDANGLPDAAELKRLADRCGDLKRELVAFAESKRFERWRVAELRKASETPDGPPPPPGSDRWIAAMDDFVMTFRFPDGTGVIDRYLSAHAKNLRKSDRTLLQGWRDPVDGIFELRAKTDDEITLYNLIDELEYRTYASMSFAGLSADVGDFVLARLVPMAPGAWSVSGSLTPFPREHATVVAQLALEWLQTRPRLAFRNPEKRELGWQLMREDQARFKEFFGSDQLTLPAHEALDRLNAYYRDRQEKVLAEQHPDGDVPEAAKDPDESFFALPEEELKLFGTIGVIFDETDGMSLLPDFGTLEELFADPSLAGDKRHKDILLGYLDSDSIYPGPLRRLAAAHPDTVDDVYRTILKKPAFTWDKQGEHLLRKRKPWYFKEERYPKTTPASDYLLELMSS